jgi:phosphatidylglycerol lysyltransferase
LVLVTFALARLLRPVAPLQALPSETELDRVAALASISPHASAYLALLGDKHLLFHESGAGFLMYGVHGRGWVSMGDPIGPPEVRRELAWRFRELADQNRGLAIFYEVRDESLPLYLDLGLDLRKLGEEARVPLDDFSLAHPSRKRLRQAMSRMRREGCRFELIRRERAADPRQLEGSPTGGWRPSTRGRSVSRSDTSIAAISRAYRSRW